MENANVNSVVLVVGATGALGTEICRQLKEQQYKVRGLVRATSDPVKVEALHQLGAETIIGDIKDPTSIDRAMAGVDLVISTTSSTSSRQEGDSIETVDLQGQINVIDAAERAGVKHFVYISVVEMDQEFPLQTAKRKVEEHLKRSAMRYTILRPAMFMEVWLSPHLGFDYLHSRATIFGEGMNPISWISIKDVGAFAVEALGNPDAADKTLTIGGPQAMSPLEVVREFEHHLGTPFRLEHIPLEALLARRKEAAAPLEESFASLQIAYARGCEVPMDNILNSFPIKLHSISNYADRVTPVKGAVL